MKYLMIRHKMSETDAWCVYSWTNNHVYIFDQHLLCWGNPIPYTVGSWNALCSIDSHTAITNPCAVKRHIRKLGGTP